MYVCARMRACVRVCVLAGVRACVPHAIESHCTVVVCKVGMLCIRQLAAS